MGKNGDGYEDAATEEYGDEVSRRLRRIGARRCAPTHAAEIGLLLLPRGKQEWQQLANAHRHKTCAHRGEQPPT